MQAPPQPPNEALRLDALHALGQIDTASEERFDRIVDITKLIFEVPICLLTMVDAERQWFKARTGVGETGTRRSISFCGHAITQAEVFVVEDALRDPRFDDNPMVNGPPYMRFYAGAPLEICRDVRVGTLCIIDTQPREFPPEQHRLLRRLGDIARDELVRPRARDADDLAPQPEELADRHSWGERLRAVWT